MIWISLILGIIQAIPTIMKLVQEIIDMIHQRQGTDRAGLEHELFGLVHQWHVDRDNGKLVTALEALRSRLASV